VAYAYNPSYAAGRDQEDHSLRPVHGRELARPYFKRAEGAAQAVEHLLSKCEALRLNSSITEQVCLN
jgi:hypothetical protein